MTRDDVIALVEALYRLRLVAAYRVKNDAQAMMRDGIVAAERELAAILRRAEIDPGTTAQEADALKLRFLRREVDVLPPPLDFVRLLEEAAEADGSAFRGLQITVGRFAEFWQRAFYAVPRTNPMTGELLPAVLPDDPVWPVGAFLERHERPDGADVAGWLQLYILWSKEAHAAFLAGIGMSGGTKDVGEAEDG